MIYSFRKEDEDKIISRFGQDFYRNVCGSIGPLTTKWQLTELQLIDSFSSSLVFKGHSRLFGRVVMKYLANSTEHLNEVNALKVFKGENVCKLFDVDFDRRVILEEGIYPGTDLSKEIQLEKRLNVFYKMYNDLHSNKNPERNVHIKTYEEWIFRIAAYMEEQNGWEELAFHMKRAKHLFLELSKDFNGKRLLHGDFHYYNILKSEAGYKIIDPKGVVGDPVFDLPRYLLNEFWDERDGSKVDVTMEKSFAFLSSKLNLSKEILSKLLYIEGAMAICWDVEDGANFREKKGFLDILEKLSMYVDQYSGGLK